MKNRKKKKSRSDPFQPDPSKEIKKKSKKIKKYHPGSIWNRNGAGKAESLRKKNISFRSVSTRTGVENAKKIAEKFKKLKNIILASFQAETGCDKLKNREK